MMRLLLWGAVCIGLSLCWNVVLPINKKIWTDSFMLFSGGFCLLALAFVAWLVDRRGWRWGITPAQIFGSNAILAFALATVLYPLERMLQFHDASGHLQTIHEMVFKFFAQWMSPYNASLGYAVVFVGFNAVLLWPLWHKKIFLRL